jgi:hypothetical protein
MSTQNIDYDFEGHTVKLKYTKLTCGAIQIIDVVFPPIMTDEYRNAFLVEIHCGKGKTLL